MLFPKKLNRPVPKLDKKLDESESSSIAQKVHPGTPRIRSGFQRPLQPLDDQPEIQRRRNLKRMSKSHDNFDVIETFDGTDENDPETLTSSTSELVDSQDNLPNPQINTKKSLSKYFKKFIKHDSAESKYANNNMANGESQGSGKSGLMKFKNISKSVNSLFDRPTYDVSGTKKIKQTRTEKMSKGTNKEKVKTQNEVDSHWLDTASILTDDPGKPGSDTKVTKKRKGNFISRVVTRKDKESTSTVITDVISKQNFDAFSYELDSDFDEEITETTSLPESEKDQNMSRVTIPEVHPSSVHDSIQADDGCHSSSPVAVRYKLALPSSEKPIPPVEHEHILPTGVSEEKVECSRPVSLEMEERFKNLRQELMMVVSRVGRDDTKISDSDKVSSWTESVGISIRNPMRSTFLVRSSPSRCHDKSGEQNVTSASSPRAQAEDEEQYHTTVWY